jgi:phosphatidylglycerophosphate synthase
MVNKIPAYLDNPINYPIYSHIDTTLDTYYKLNFTPNILTTISLILGLSSVYAVYKDYYKTGALLFFIAYYYDCADGKFARKYNQVTKFGDYYDHISDFIKFGLMFYVLYLKIQPKSFQTKLILFTILILLFVLAILQFGCQEILYQYSESPSVKWTTYFVNPANCKNQVKYTRYFSMTTLTIYICVCLLLWTFI